MRTKLQYSQVDAVHLDRFEESSHLRHLQVFVEVYLKQAELKSVPAKEFGVDSGNWFSGVIVKTHWVGAVNRISEGWKVQVEKPWEQMCRLAEVAHRPNMLKV